MGIADEATVAVAATVEGKRRMLIRMERTQGLMVAHLEPQGLSDLLDRQVLKLLNIETTPSLLRRLRQIPVLPFAILQ